MPNRITNALATALVAALPLGLAGVAGAQTATETDPTQTEATETDATETEATETDATETEGTETGGTEAEAGEGAAAEEEAPSGPKRYKVPEQAQQDGQGTGIPALDQALEAQRAAEEQAKAAEDAATEAAEQETEVVETVEEGKGPFVGDYTIGDPDAPVQVIEYASLTCPHCAAFHEETWPELKEEFVEPGRIGFTLRDVYFDRFGLWAAMASRCGGEAAFYPMVDQYMIHQQEWTQADNIAQAIAGIARRGGLTDAEIKACLENQEFAKLLVETYQENATADEVQSTPTFLIRGPDGTEKVVGNQPAEVRQAIEEALAAAG